MKANIPVALAIDNLTVQQLKAIIRELGKERESPTDVEAIIRDLAQQQRI